MTVGTEVALPRGMVDFHSSPLRTARTSALFVLLASSFGSTALAQGVVENPRLGRPCLEEGPDCFSSPSRLFDIQINLGFDVTQDNFVETRALRDINGDLNDFNNWQNTASFFWSTTSGIPSWNIFIQDAPIRVFDTQQGTEGWRAGGLGRAAGLRWQFEPFFPEYLEARFVSAFGVPQPYPGAWNLAGVPLDPANAPQGNASRSIFILADDTVTPADNSKLGNFLINKRFGISNPIDDTKAYYRRVCGDAAADSLCARDKLNTLANFRAKFQMQTVDGGAPAAGETVATYYNRGDLGIGREMHCIRQAATQDIACYVKNFGDFGAAPPWAPGGFNVAPFATVAMISRASYGPLAPDKVVFFVYDGSGNLTFQAALDQHAKGGLGTDGTNYNAHIPSNCMSCHGGGGSYVSATATDISSRGARGAMFLPFDLDQFEYNPFTAALTRLEQEDEFKKLNIDFVRKVALDYGATRAGAIINTIDGWYENGLRATFKSEYEPPDWAASLWDGFYGDSHFYHKVLRPYCRGCHMTFGLDDNRSFERWDAYDFYRTSASTRICPTPGTTSSRPMPHAEQVSRNFWHSDARAILVAYHTGSGDYSIKDCVPGADR